LLLPYLIFDVGFSTVLSIGSPKSFYWLPEKKKLKIQEDLGIIIILL